MSCPQIFWIFLLYQPTRRHWRPTWEKEVAFLVLSWSLSHVKLSCTCNRCCWWLCSRTGYPATSSTFWLRRRCPFWKWVGNPGERGEREYGIRNTEYGSLLNRPFCPCQFKKRKMEKKNNSMYMYIRETWKFKTRRFQATLYTNVWTPIQFATSTDATLIESSSVYLHARTRAHTHLRS